MDASTMEANAALKTIVRWDTGEGYRKMLLRMTKESRIDSPTDDDLAHMDRKRVGKTLSNNDWQSQVVPESKITNMQEGRTHLAYKPEHAVDLDTGAVVAVEVHEADKGDTSTLQKTLETAQESLRRVSPPPPYPDDPAELVADKAIFRGTSSRIWTVGHGGQESPNPSAKACTTGVATMRRGAPCTTTAFG